MKKISLILILISFVSNASFAQKWEMKQARIMSPWAEKIDPKKVLDEYPRPQMVRNNWYNLNGVWDFTKVEAMAYNASQTYDKKILVPFPMESAISGIMDTNHDENKGKVFAYRRKFTIPGNMKKGQILLHFGAVDWKCEVYVNGKKVGMHTGGFDPFSFDITDAVSNKKEQEICVFVQDYQEFGGQPHGKQKIGEKVIWYTPATGIWQTVWLESVPKTHIEKLVLVPDIDNKTINVKVLVDNADENTKATIKIYDGKEVVFTTNNADVNTNVPIVIEDMKLWSPESPFLYDLKIELTGRQKVIDEVDSYFGMRKISVEYFNGHPTMYLNNKHYFHYGVLDQGYWPDGIYTAPTDEALKFDLVKIKEFGMNMSRKHIKVEPARWYYHCDKMGLLVWQDIPNPGFGENGKIIGENNLDLRDNFHDEMVRIMKSLENHPSIVLWTVYNEGWGQPNEATTRRSVEIAQQTDPHRLISAASGWNDYECGDIKDTHWYPEPNVLPNPVNKRASVCGEYGGITYIVDGHRWIGGSNMKYTQVNSSEELKDRFIEFTNQILGLQANGLCAAVYTQITDVEDEENGLITYDRKVVKVDNNQLAEVRKAIERNITHTSRPVMPVSQAGNTFSKWKYYMSDKALADNSWKDETFADNYWKTGTAGFGSGGLQGASINTKWNTPYIYLRKWQNLRGVRQENLSQLRMMVFHDEDCEIYINGVLAASLPKYTNRYKIVEISKEAKAAIKFNEPNLIAVKCVNKEGNQFIDLGFCFYDIDINALTRTRR